VSQVPMALSIRDNTQQPAYRPSDHLLPTS
jgi:hypothetical protein